MPTYYHGVRVQENPTSVPNPVKNETGVPVVFGTAPINLAADPAHATNKLFLCNSFAEAKAALGYSEDYANYTLCQAMDAFFKVFAVAPVVFVNVLDPTTHKKAFTETITVTSGIAKSAKKDIYTPGLVITDGSDTLVEGTDYTLSFDNEGYLVVTVLAGSVSSVVLTGNQIDPSLVTATTVIGGIDALTGAESGIECVRKVWPELGLTPSLLLAPGWSQNASVGLTLHEKCEDLNGVFRCECVVDLPTSGTGAAAKYTDVATTKATLAYEGNHMIALWPMVKCMGQKMYFSAVYAAMACYTDYNNGNTPELSPSNKSIKCSAAVLADGTEVVLDIPQANTLNAVGVVTAVNIQGVFKSWGNNTAAYPATTDPKDRWICCRRFFSWWGNSFITNYLVKVDNPANYRLIESIVDSENVRGNALVSQGKCAGIKTVYSKADNPVANVLDGKIVFRQYLAPYTPAEDILNILEYDVSMLEAALGGE